MSTLRNVLLICPSIFDLNIPMLLLTPLRFEKGGEQEECDFDFQINAVGVLRTSYSKNLLLLRE
jgi:hypothetical protein